jgi:hypothetical protein
MWKVIPAVVLALVAGGAQAATLNVVGGQLMGAFGVDVGGILYDVAFVDDTCIQLFNGCDESSDFTFTGSTSAGARLAAQALLDQVFLDGPSGAFDTQPELTNGCEAASFAACSVFIPWLYESPSPGFRYANSLNADTNSGDNGNGQGSIVLSYADSIVLSSTLDVLGYANVYSQWNTTVVPEPSTALLLGLGLLGMAGRSRQ